MIRLIGLTVPPLLLFALALSAPPLNGWGAFATPSALWSTSHQTEQRGPREEIPSPRDWVSFEADVRVMSPGKAEVSGRFHRGSDGSERLVTTLNGRQMVVSIWHVPSSTYYLRRPDGMWVSGPMKLPQSGWRPPPCANNR